MSIKEHERLTVGDLVRKLQDIDPDVLVAIDDAEVENGSDGYVKTATKKLPTLKVRNALWHSDGYVLLPNNEGDGDTRVVIFTSYEELYEEDPPVTRGNGDGLNG